jgi:hypothetical protein
MYCFSIRWCFINSFNWLFTKKKWIQTDSTNDETVLL